MVAPTPFTSTRSVGRFRSAYGPTSKRSYAENVDLRTAGGNTRRFLFGALEFARNLGMRARLERGHRSDMADEKRLVWDLPLRIFHWLLVLCMAASWTTAELGFEWTQIHMYLGYTTMGLLVFRIIWGFVGPRH